jgi:hypothetical protein
MIVADVVAVADTWANVLMLNPISVNVSAMSFVVAFIVMGFSFIS